MLRSNPLIKLVLPFVLGIAFGWYCNISLLHISVLFALSFVTLLLSFLNLAPKWKILFGVGVIGVMLSLGLFSEHCQQKEKAAVWSREKIEYSARLVEVPLMRGTNVRVLAEVEAADTFLLSGCRKRGLAYLYFSPSVETEQLQIGDVITFETILSPPVNNGNPAEFDIEEFYYVRNITATAFIPNDAWSLEQRGVDDLSTMALRARERIVDLYRCNGFDGDRLALLSALTIGEKRDFPQKLKESYPIAGASHVLALSGLHLGIFYMLISFLIPYRGRKRLLIIFRELAVVSILWGFAFVAGLSPSVVRAAILFSLMSLARCLARDVSSLSSLSFAALAMLVFDPHMLFDVSFQLSFAAVLAILILQPPIRDLLRVANYGVVWRYVVDILILSFVAQVGTLPLVWCYFGVFPLYFLLTNIVVVPLAFVVMLLAVLLWVLSPVNFLSQSVAWLLDAVVSFMNNVVGWVSSLPAASVALPSLGTVELVLFFVLFLAIIVSLVKHKWREGLFCFVIALFAVVVYWVAGNEKAAEKYLLIYNNRKNPLVHIVDGKENYLLSTVPQLDAEYEYSSAPYIKRERLHEPVWAGCECANSHFSFNEGLLSYAGFKIRLLDNDSWRNNVYSEPTDVVVLCRGFLGSIKELLEVYPAGCIVMDASLYKRSRQRIMRECAALDVEVLDVANTGALMFLPGDDSFEFVSMRGK